MKNHAKNALIALLALMFILSITRLAHAAGPVGPVMYLPPTTTTSDAVITQWSGSTPPWPNSYFQFTFTGVPSGYNVANGPYNAWCVDENNYIYVGEQYQVVFYSSYDYQHNPYPNANWPKVNYVLNHKQGLENDVQTVIWHYIDHGESATSDQAEISMVNDADANGANFVPAPGQLIAIVCWIGSTVQTNFIEVVVPAHLTLISTYGTTSGQGWYNVGSQAPFSVSPTTIPQGTESLVFTGWSSSDANGYTGPASSYTVTMKNDITETAQWVLRSPGPSVGGEWTPITMQAATPLNALQLLAPWIGTALMMAILASFVGIRRIRKRRH